MNLLIATETTRYFVQNDRPDQFFEDANVLHEHLQEQL